MRHFHHGDYIAYKWTICLRRKQGWIGLLSQHPIQYSLSLHIEALFFELNLKIQKWLVFCSYHPYKNLIKEHIQVLTEGTQFYSQDRENILLMGDYNIEITETNKSSFCEIYHLIDITKQPSCFKNPSNSSFIDLFLLTIQTVSKNLQFLKPVFLISISFLSETTTRGVLWRNMFLEISQDSQENNCTRVSFSIK